MPADGTQAERYTGRRDAARAERDRLTRRTATISNLRLLAFVAGIGVLVWAEIQPEHSGLALALAATAATAFLVLVGLHSRISERRRWSGEMARVNEEALARLRRDWDALPETTRKAPDHRYAGDLDIFGHGSLARLLSTGTGVGRARLDRWLLDPATVPEAERRQEAARELVPMLEFRQELAVAGRLAGDPGATLDAFLDWAEDEPWLLARPWLLWSARLLPAATVAFAALQIEGVVGRPWWLVTLVLGTLLTAATWKPMQRLLDRASLGDASLRSFASVVGRVQDQTFESPPLAAVHEALSGECDARRELDRLGWITELAELRHGGLFYALVHLPTLWDFHVLWALERWQRRAGRHVREWVDRVAEIDALAALAMPAFDEPGWSFPELLTGPATPGEDDPGRHDHAGEPDRPDAADDPGARRLIARDLAHPLLPADQRVANDVELGPPGTFLMVTGSNMSGKSTLLRAIGVNVVLAQAGGPVCAASLRLPPVDVYSSIRVDDSLERGVSLFMAELQQLKRVVDAAHREDGRLLLYLLDEVLHGTNTAERQVAVREVLEHLLRESAIGAISTHDLGLADAPPLDDAVVPVHFRETVHPEGHDPPMTFDYRLRDGIAQSTNALKLVRLVGLGR